MKIRNEVCSVRLPFGRITSHGKVDDSYFTGCVVTKYGAVVVYAQGSATSKQQTRLDIIKNGKLHLRYFNKRYSARGLVTVANKFAAELFA